MSAIYTGTERMAPNGAKVTEATGLPTPFAPSWSYISSMRDWRKVRDILGGADQVRAQRETYLPRYTRETDEDYDRRVKFAPFENHFADALDGLCDKPFGKPITLAEDASDPIKEISNDVDGNGASLHIMGRDVFREGAGFGRAGIFVDFPAMREGATKADAEAIKARPYWMMVQCEDILVLQRKRVGSKQIISRLSFVERHEEFHGSLSVMMRTIRTYTHDGVGLVEYTISRETMSGEWIDQEEGELKGMSQVPFAEFMIARQDRYSGRYIPPLIALADLQIEHYQQSANLKHILWRAAFPMLVGNGVTPPLDETGKVAPIYTGPGAVLYAPPQPGTNAQPEWQFLEPAGTSIDKLLENLDRIETAIDKLGKAPLVKKTGSVTATSDAINTAKGHATAEAWAAVLQETLKTALGFTAEWLGEAEEEIGVTVDTDFGIEENSATDATELRSQYAAGLLSRKTLWEEERRRGFLSPSFDPDEEEGRLAEEHASKIEKQQAEIDAGIVADPTGGNRQPGQAPTDKKPRDRKPKAGARGAGAAGSGSRKPVEKPNEIKRAS